MNTRFPMLLLAAMLVAAASMHAQPSVRSLMPHPKVAFDRSGAFAVRSKTPIVVPNDADSATLRAALYFQREVRMRQGALNPIIRDSQYVQPFPDFAVRIGLWSDTALRARIVARLPRGEWNAPAGGYVLDVSTQGDLLLVGADEEGVFNGVATMVQLSSPGQTGLFIRCAHIYDYPDYPIRWVFSQHNLRGANAIVNLRRIQDTMAYYKLNGLQQNDFKYNILESQPANYFDSVRALRANALETNSMIIPGIADIGYSEGILWHDPNLAEGFSSAAAYVFAGDTGRIIPDTRVALPNGAMENIGGNGKFTGWSFYDDGSVTADHSIVHGGSTSARCSNFIAGNASGNCRFNLRVICQPHRAYVMHAWVRTQDLRCDEVRLLALGTDTAGNTRALTATAFSIPATTSGWVPVEVTFNTLEYTSMLLYAGVWGGSAGTIWWDDIEIHDAGLTNVLRRPGTPVHVYDLRTFSEVKEGVDVAPIVDPALAASNGSYGPWHSPPTLRRQPGGGISNGDTVVVSWFHPVTTVSGTDGNGQVMVCVSEPKLYDVLADQIRRVDSLYHPQQFFLGHDEIRVMNRDSACLARGMSPARLLADNVRRCIELVEQTHPGATTLLWSDMFDNEHNAVPNYYLVNGDLTGVVDSIPRSATIVNWNFGKRDASLAWFNARGFRQIAAPYYDEGGTSNMRAWRISLEPYREAKGMMYTTWSADYRYLRPFAYYAWRAGPYVIHEPLDTSAIPAVGGMPHPLCVFATILPDPFDPSDSIANVSIVASSPTFPGGRITVPMHRDTGDVFFGCIDSITDAGFSYWITATNAQGIVNRGPQYIVTRAVPASVPVEHGAAALALEAAPNPAASQTRVTFAMQVRGAWEMEMSDLNGRTVWRRSGIAEAGEQRVEINTADLASGVYTVTVRAAGHAGACTVHVLR